MSAKILYSLSDEKPNLQKQVGCMNGIFQLFERQSFLTERSIYGLNHKRLPPGQSKNNGESFMDAIHKTKDKAQKLKREKQRNSSESPRVSTSSSASTMSSVDYNQKAQVEQPSFHQNLCCKTKRDDLKTTQGSCSPRTSHQTHQPSVFKDSVHNRQSSTKVTTREQVESHSIRQIDSPRPHHRSKWDKPKASAPHESLIPIANPESMPPTSITDRKRLSLSKDAPRWSYDERESRNNSKSSTKLKELPRLSLDSRGQSISGTTSQRKSDFIPTDMQGGGPLHRKNETPQEPGSYRPLSNIVVKLMGLDVLPDSATTVDRIQPGQLNVNENPDIFSRSSRSIDENRIRQVPESPRNKENDLKTARLSNVDSTIKYRPASTDSLEPIKLQEEPPGTGKVVSEDDEGNADPPNLAISIYSEVEKRLSELDFRNSGKDLRALKQILEAMHRTRSMLNGRREDQGSDSPSHMSNIGTRFTTPSHHLTTSKGQNIRASKSTATSSIGSEPLKDIVSSTIRSEDKLPTYVVLEETRSDIPNLQRPRSQQSTGGKRHSQEKRITRDLPANSRFREPSCQTLVVPTEKPSTVNTITSIKTSKMPQHVSQDKVKFPGKSKETMSPKLQQSSLRSEVDYHLPATSSGPRRTKCHNEQRIGLGSLSGNFRGKTPFNHTKYSKATAGSANPSQQCKAAVSQSHSGNKLACQNNQEAKRESALSNATLKKDIAEYPEADATEGSVMKIATAVTEHPSPVSVLDAAFDEDESPSPVRKKLVSFRDEEASVSPQAEERGMHLNKLPFSKRLGLNSEICYQDLDTFKHIAQKLWQLKSTQEASQDSVISLYKNLEEEERYVFEILFVTGFIGDQNVNLLDNSVQRTTQAINPRLFLVLEHTQRGMFLPYNELSSSKVNSSPRLKDELQRRLAFDVANEILVQKLHSKGSCSQMQISSNWLKRNDNSGQQLFREVCSEMDRLQASSSNSSLDKEEDFLTNIIFKDLMQESEPWANCSSEVSGLVLDIERLIFKDLIVELAHGEIENLMMQKRVYCNY